MLKKILKCVKNFYEKIGKNRKKIIRKIINNTCIYEYMTYWQYLIKVGRRRQKKKKKEEEDRKVL